jgi:DNA polymerase III gamma/tau subunit
MLMDVAKKEGFEIDPDGAELLAILADGSFRDGLGELQKVLNFSQSKKITRADIEKITGAPKTILINDFISAIAEKNPEKGIEAVRKASAENLDLKLYFKLIIQKFRMAIILRYAPKLKSGSTENFPEADLEFFKNLLEKNSQMFNSAALAILLESYQNMDNAFIAELPLEIALIKINSEIG